MPIGGFEQLDKRRFSFSSNNGVTRGKQAPYLPRIPQIFDIIADLSTADAQGRGRMDILNDIAHVDRER
jgi:hypothetical protein